MKRSSIGLAATTALGVLGAALASQAHAQSNVTIYGIVDAGVEYVNHASDNGGAARAVSGGKNTSRFGFKGSEDLGNDLKAVFQLESGINLVNGQFDDGPGAIFDRRATVGLSQKKWGQVTIGRTFTTTYDYMLQFDPMGYAPNYSWATSSTATGARKDGLFSRSANAVRYDGEFNGLKLGAMYGFGNVPGSMKTSSKYDFAVGYENGPFAVVATYDRQNGAGTSTSPADTTDYIQGIHAGASYSFGPAKVMAGYRNYKKTFITAGTASLRSDMYWLGGSYDFTPAFTLYGAIYHQDIKDAGDADPTLISLRAQYAMSKRTSLYLSGGYAFAKHGQKVSLSRDLVGAADTQVGVTAGIQHRF
ncbi:MULTISPECIES: porin [Pandoraea]|uniref:Porin n=2 Tax=Pandoraea TaxID=93217 RepID=A0A5E4RXN1_9BURK|nr:MULTISPECIES: porin [Pandoraea]ALS60010.1 porin [Pandoraea norimbergensis]VVD67865.1 porin [Pandoraea iniqua]VVD71540.1 porin [Pandoraea iniqua]